MSFTLPASMQGRQFSFRAEPGTQVTFQEATGGLVHDRLRELEARVKKLEGESAEHIFAARAFRMFATIATPFCFFLLVLVLLCLVLR